MARAGPAILLAAALSGCGQTQFYDGVPLSDRQVAFVEAERFFAAEAEFTIDGVAAGSLAQYALPPGKPGSWQPETPVSSASSSPRPRVSMPLTSKKHRKSLP